MSKIQQIKQWQGWRVSAIAAQLRLDRKTVRKYAEQQDFSPQRPVKRGRVSKLAPYQATIDRWLDKVSVGGFVQIINATGTFGFFVFLPLFLTKTVSFTLSQSGLQINGAMFLSNIIWNLLWGVLGDYLGWRNTLLWFGGIGCGIATVLLCYIPLNAGANYGVVLLVAVFYRATLAAYVPLSALMPSMAPEKSRWSHGHLKPGGMPIKFS